MTTTNVTGAQVDAGLLDTDGAHWTGNITFSIPGVGAVWDASYNTAPAQGEPFDAAYSTFNATQAANYAIVASIWDSYIAPSITQVSDTTPGEIRIAFTNVVSRAGAGTYAYAYEPPVGAEQPVNGDIWVDSSNAGATFAQGSYDFQALLHETGHALGLKHPFEAPLLQPTQYDSTIYTLMSYTSPDWVFTFNNGGGGGIGYTSAVTTDLTPMVLDIKAIQDLYGVDPNTNSGNTTYTFHDSDLTSRQSIYDAGGTDTIDISALSRGSHVDLTPGAYSDLDYYTTAQQEDDLAAQYGESFRNFIHTALNNPSEPAYTWSNNLGISFSTTIENVVGSAQADTIVGNSVANVITGGGGADTETGGGGADVFKDTAANLNGDTITDFVNAYTINVTNALAALVNLSYVGTTLSFALATAPGTTYTMTLNGSPTGTVLQHTDLNGGVDIVFGAAGTPSTPTIAVVVDHGNHFDVQGTADAGNTVTIADTNAGVPPFTATATAGGTYDAASTAALVNGSHTLDAGASNGVLTSGFSTAAHLSADTADHVVFSDVSFTIADDSTFTGLVLEGAGLTGTANSHGIQIASIESSTGSVNTLIGGAGHDNLVGGIGADHLQGGDADDIYTINNSATQISDSSGLFDIAYAQGVSYALATGDGVDLLTMVGNGLTGTGHTTTGTGLFSIETSASDVNTLIGGSSTDSLVGGIGADRLQGGGGNDTYTLYNSATQISDTGGLDIAYAQGVSYALATGDGVDVLATVGNGLTGTGHTTTATQLYSVEASASDVNTLIGGSGDDFLFGGIGADHLQGGTGNDTYTINNSATQITDTGGTDLVFAQGVNYTIADGSGIDALTLVGNNLTGTGSSGDDVFRSSGTGNVFNGGSAGNDTFVFDRTITSGDFVTGFTPHTSATVGDTIFLQNFPDTTFDAAVADGHIATSGANVVVSDGTHAIVTLDNVTLASLHANDFIFA